jgi:hypothetical protein
MHPSDHTKGDPMEKGLPESIAAITAPWLSDVLGAPVRSFDAVTIGEGVGILSELARLTIDYDQHGAGPPSVVAKLHSVHADNRAMAMHFRLYEREVSFYGELGADAGIGVPQCHFAGIDTDNAQFALILEDMGGGRFGDQVAGLSLADTEVALRALAGLHARWWDDPRLEKLEWLLPLNHPITKSAQDRYQALWSLFVDNIGRVLSDDERALGERMADRFHDVLDRLTVPPFTFLHGDFRADNFVFEPLGGSKPFAVCDWQIVGQGHGGAFDVAYCLGVSVDPDVRRSHLQALLRTYHEALLSNGVNDYDFDAFVADMRLGALVCLLYPVNGAQLDLANERGVRLLERTAQGSFGLAMDLEAVTAL